MTQQQIHHRIVIIGGGNAGIAVAAQLTKRGESDIAIIDPAETHYYQPLWTLVGGGCAQIEKSARKQEDVIPKGVRWYQYTASGIDPDQRIVTLDQDRSIKYDVLVVAPGIQLDWHKIPGLSDAVWSNSGSSNYDAVLAPKTWELIKRTKRGTAVFTQPSGPIKCAGAPQKIAYLAADYWRRQGVLDNIRIVLVLPTPGLFGVPVFADALRKVVDEYGIEVQFSSEVVEFDTARQLAIVRDNIADSKQSIEYDMVHAVPPQSAPDWLAGTSLAGAADPNGYVEVDKHSLQHVRYPEVFALGDAGSTPNSKTGAAIRKQAPVVVANIQDQLANRKISASYNGYAGCPLTTSRNRMLLAEFDYSMTPTPSIPGLDLTKPRRDMWLLKKYGLPTLYWNAIVKGRL